MQEVTDGLGAEAQLRTYTRRDVVALGMATAGVLALSGYRLPRALAFASEDPIDFVLRPAPHTFEIAGQKVETWAYNGKLPGPELRVRQGQRVRIKVENGLPVGTTVHWHGIRLDNAMDGVPGMTQPAIAPGRSFIYEFTPPDAGTYFFHPHVGLQLDRGLYGALIVEPSHEPLSYDREETIILDDWVDGIDGLTPERVYARLRAGGMAMSMGMEGMAMGTVGGRYKTATGATPLFSNLAGLANLLEAGTADAGDVTYPHYLLNGQHSADPFTLHVKRGERVRLRLINSAADTLFAFNIDGHTLTVVAADGQPIAHRRTDAVVLGMGERADVLLDADNRGAFQMVAKALGKKAAAFGVLAYEGTHATLRPVATTKPLRIVSYRDLRSAPVTPLLKPTRTIRLPLLMNMMEGYEWTIGNQPFADADTIEIAKGEHVQLELVNRTTMPHPIHLHGNFFQVVGINGHPLLKDTVTVGPKQTTTVQLAPTNPGKWMLHCHNDYHLVSGMMRTVDVS